MFYGYLIVMSVIDNGHLKLLLYQRMYICRGCQVDLNPPPIRLGFQVPGTQVPGPETLYIGGVSRPIRRDICKRKEEGVKGLETPVCTRLCLDYRGPVNR